jgi:hypothetical protein
VRQKHIQYRSNFRVKRRLAPQQPDALPLYPSGYTFFEKGFNFFDRDVRFAGSLCARTIAVVAFQIATVGHIDFRIYMTSGELCTQHAGDPFLGTDKLIEIQNQSFECDISMHCKMCH